MTNVHSLLTYYFMKRTTSITNTTKQHKQSSNTYKYYYYNSDICVCRGNSNAIYSEVGNGPYVVVHSSIYGNIIDSNRSTIYGNTVVVVTKS